MTRVTVIHSHHSVNGLTFGCSEQQVIALHGRPDKVAQNYTGEIELLFGATIVRCYGGRFVECTVPDHGRFSIDGVDVLSMFDWLAGCADVVDKARFRISLQHGVAYDFRDPRNGSITVFEKGRWDSLVLA